MARTIFKYRMLMNRRNKRLVAGTDYRYYPPHQIYNSQYKPPLLFPDKEPYFGNEVHHRKINLKNFDIIETTIVMEDKNE